MEDKLKGEEGEREGSGRWGGGAAREGKEKKEERRGREKNGSER